jgi:hypothetical protein
VPTNHYRQVVIWIVLGVIALAIVLLVGAVMGLLGRLRVLDRAVRRTRLRAEQAEKLQVKIEALRVRVEGMKDGLEEVAAGAERLRDRRASR